MTDERQQAELERSFRGAIKPAYAKRRSTRESIRTLVDAVCDSFDVEAPEFRQPLPSTPTRDTVFGQLAELFRRAGFAVRRVSTPHSPNPLRGAIITTRKTALEPVAFVRKPVGRTVLIDAGTEPVEIDSEATGTENWHDTALEVLPVTPGRESKDATDLLRAVWSRTFRREGGRMLIFATMAGVLATALPIVTGILVERVIPDGNIGALADWASVLVGLAVTSSLLTWAWRRSSTRFKSLAGSRLELILAGPSSLDSGKSFRENMRPAAVARSSAQAVHALSNDLGDLAALVLTCITVAVVLFLHDARLAAWLALIPAPVIVLAGSWQYWRETAAWSESRARSLDAKADISTLMMDRNRHVQTGQAHRLTAPALRAQGLFEHARQIFERYADGRRSWVAVSEPLAIALLIGTATILSSVGMTIDTGAFVAFAAAMMVLAASSGQLVDKIFSVSRALTELQQADETLEPDPIEEPAGHIPPHAESVSISDLDVELPAHPEPLIRNASLTMQLGECVAIVGEESAGKSALLKALFTPDQAPRPKIRWDENMIDLQALDPSAMAVAYVPERVTCEGTLRSCLELGDRDALAWSTLEELELRRWAESLGGTLDAYLAPDAVQPTLECARRLAIAGALLGDAKFVVLDSPFRDVSGKGRRWLEQRLQGDKAILLTTADPDVAALADRVYRIEGDRLVEVEDTASI